MYETDKDKDVSKNMRQLVIGRSWQYLYENFHKFSEHNRIKIALAITQKSMPTEIQGELTGATQVVIIRETNRGNQGEGGRLSRPISLVREEVSPM